MSTSVGMISTFLLIFLLSFFALDVHAGSWEVNPGCGTYARHLERIPQDFAPSVNELRFIAWQREETVHICGYRVTIDCFPQVICWFIDPEHHMVQVRARGADVGYRSWCEIDVEFWLDPKWNTVRKGTMQWGHEGGLISGPPPDHGWVVKPKWENIKPVTIFNDDLNRSFTISDFRYYASKKRLPDLKTVPFNKSIPGEFTLLPGENRSFYLDVPLRYGHLYFYNKMLDAPNGKLLAEEWADHEIFVEVPVGGRAVVVPAGRFDVNPYIGFASTILVATAAAAVYVNHVKRRKKKQ